MSYQRAAANDVVYHCLTPDPSQSLLFANGATGGSVHTPDDSLSLNICRCDTLTGANTLGALAGVRIRGNPGLFTGATEIKQVWNLAEAKIIIDLHTPHGPVSFTVTCLYGHDLVLVDIIDGRSVAMAFTIELIDWHPGSTPVRTAGGSLLSTTVVTHSCFSDYAARVRVDTNTPGVADPLLGRAWGISLRAGNDNNAATTDTDVDADLATGEGATTVAIELKPAPSHCLRIATACTPPPAQGDSENIVSEDTVDGKINHLLSADCDQMAKWREDHATHWRNFWGRSGLALYSDSGDAEYEERLWYVAIYTIAAGCGGPLPMRFNGGAYLLDRDKRSWDGGYWFQNMREVYWPLYAAGHAELSRDYFNLFWEARHYVRAQTESLFGIPGLSFRETQSPWGHDVNTDLTTGATSPSTHHYFSGNLEALLLMEWYVDYSGDLDFLRQQLYPLLKDILTFYLGYLTPGPDGLLHLEPVNSLETWVDVRDDIVNLCGLHHFLPRAVEWGECFDEDADQLAVWRAAAAALPPLPVGEWTLQRTTGPGLHTTDTALAANATEDGIFLPAAGLGTGPDLSPIPALRHNMENAELYPIFPWGVVGRDSPPAEVRRAERTWYHRTWRLVNNGWAQDAIQCARMGWRERFAATLKLHASYNQRFPNGCFISPASPHFHGAVTEAPYFDTAGVHAAALNEAMLQSFDGVVRLCPATPAAWSGHFTLHARDGLVVTATFKQGAPTSATIAATRLATLRLRNDRTETMHLHAEGATALITAVTGTVAELSLDADSIVHVSWENVIADPHADAPRAEVLYPDYKIAPPPLMNRSGHWHDEGWGHGQVGLGEDGLFAATRQPQSAGCNESGANVQPV